MALRSDVPHRLSPQAGRFTVPAYNSDGEVREGADVAELTRLLDLDEY